MPTLLTEPSPILRSVETRTVMAEQLEPFLQCITELRFALKTAHWNIRGENFLSIHRELDTVEGTLSVHLDQIGERLKVLGGMPRLSMRTMMVAPMLQEMPASTNIEENLVAILKSLIAHNSWVTYAARTADKIVDLPTMDMLIKQSSEIEQHCYLLGQNLPVQVMTSVVNEVQAAMKALPRIGDKAKPVVEQPVPTND